MGSGRVMVGWLNWEWRPVGNSATLRLASGLPLHPPSSSNSLQLDVFCLSFFSEYLLTSAAKKPIHNGQGV